VGWLVGVGVIVLVVIVALIYQRHGEAGAPSEDWTRTDEVFRDPSTSRLMRVWLDLEGERHYVPEPPSEPAL
jgi:hypothetical protein